MRVLMLTDDAVIDRRIIAEARTLMDAGHELLLIAGHNPERNRFEIRDGLKIERVPFIDEMNSAIITSDQNVASLGDAIGAARTTLASLRYVLHPRNILFGSDFVSRVVTTDIRRLNWKGLILQAVLLVFFLLPYLAVVAFRMLKAAMKTGYILGRWLLVSVAKSIVVTLAPPTKRLVWTICRKRFRDAALDHDPPSPKPNLRTIPPLSIATAIETGRLPLVESWLITRIHFYRPDLVVAHDLPQLRVAVVGSRRAGAPLIYDAHELYPEINTLTAREMADLSARENRWIKGADAVITVNRFIADEMARRYDIPTPDVIWNAIDPPLASVEQTSFRERLELPAGTRVLLFQGWMSRTRGLQDLVLGFAEAAVPGLHLVFLGYGEARDELRDIANECDVTETVHFIDAVPPDELVALTATADAGIIPYQPVDLNNRLCSPNKLFEYIQAHLPIIANDLPFLSEIVGGEGFGVVADLSTPSGFAAAITKMFDESSGGPERFKPAFAAKAPEFAWAPQGEKLLGIVARVTGQELSERPAGSIPSRAA